MKQKNKVYWKDTLNVPFKPLDISITKIENDFDEHDEEYYIATTSLYESLGEQGENYTEIYNEKPSMEQIISDVKQLLKQTYEDLKENGLLTAREERYLEVLSKLDLT